MSILNDSITSSIHAKDALRLRLRLAINTRWQAMTRICSIESATRGVPAIWDHGRFIMFARWADFFTTLLLAWLHCCFQILMVLL